MLARAVQDVIIGCLAEWHRQQYYYQVELALEAMMMADWMYSVGGAPNQHPSLTPADQPRVTISGSDGGITSKPHLRH